MIQALVSILITFKDWEVIFWAVQFTSNEQAGKQMLKSFTLFIYVNL